jgi:hypothetical protein
VRGLVSKAVVGAATLIVSTIRPSLEDLLQLVSSLFLAPFVLSVPWQSCRCSQMPRMMST